MPQVDSIQELGQVFLPLNLTGFNFNPSGGNGGSLFPEYNYFILDTGAGMSAIEQQLADRLNLRTLGYDELAGTAGVQKVPLKQLDALTPFRRLMPVGELTQYGLVATAQDLSGFRVPMPGTPEAGLLGNDYLRHFVVEIDFNPPALHLSRPQGFAPPGVNIESYLPMWLDDYRVMRVKGRLDDWLEVELRLDSGAGTLQGISGPYLNITTPMWDQLCKAAANDKAGSGQSGNYMGQSTLYNFYTGLSATGIGGPVELKVGRIKSLELGPLRFEQPSVVVQPLQGIFAQPDAVGFISLNLFEPGGWLTLDYQAGRIYLPKL